MRALVAFKCCGVKSKRKTAKPRLGFKKMLGLPKKLDFQQKLYLPATFIYIIKNCLQDTSAVVRILEHTLRTLKFKHPEITSAILHQDKAGCYHNSVLLATCNPMKSKTGVRVHRVNFSDPQGGKGA